MLVKQAMEPKKHFFKQLDELFEKGLKEFSLHGDREEGIKGLTFDLTYRCNSRCIMCNLWKKDRRQPELYKHELSLGEIKRFVSESKLLTGVDIIFLAGGEPTLRDDLVEIYDFFFQRYPEVFLVILTNLVDTNRVLTQIQNIAKRCSLKNLAVGSSLDGIGVTHDMIRGKKGAFDNLLRTLEKLSTEFPEIPYRLNFTLTPKNCRDLLPAYKLADELGCGFGAQVVEQMEDTEEFCWKKEHLEIIEEQINLILASLCNKYQKFFPLLETEDKWSYASILAELYFLKSVTRYIEKPARYFRYCFSGRRFAWIDPWGRLSACPVKRDLKFGNIRDATFDDLWLSERADKVRRYIDTGRCHCWIACPIPVAREIFRCAFS